MRSNFVFLLVLFFGLSVFAHEYILIADNYVVKKGEKLELHLFVADGFNIELERPLQKAITKRFELINENGQIDLESRYNDGAIPILDIDVDFSGLGLIHMERDYARISLTNDKFKVYLTEDNIENITITEGSKTEQSERYTRYIKALVQSGKTLNDTIFRTIVGHQFEIILLDNPYTLHTGDWIKAKVLFQGRPLAHKIITARNRIGNKPATVAYSRTDVAGICKFKLKRDGNWFIHATHMIPCRDRQDSDWESFWSTFSFGIGDLIFD